MYTDKLNKLINLWYVISVTAVFFICVKYLLPISVPFIIATVAAIMLRKPVDKLSRLTRVKREAISFLCVTAMILIILGLLSLLTYSIYAWLSDLLRQLPELLPQLTAVASSVTKAISSWSEGIPQSIKENINSIPSEFVSSATKWITGTLSTMASRLPSSFITTFVTVVAAYIITRNYERLGNFVKSVIPSDKFDKLVRFKSVALNKTVGLIKGNILLTLLTYCQILIGLFALGIDHAVALAAVIAVVDLLPVFGTGTVLIPWAAYHLFTGNVAKAVGLSLLYAVTTLVKNTVSPKIIGDQIKLDSLCVLASMYIGFRLLGVGGMIAAPFAASVVKDLILE